MKTLLIASLLSGFSCAALAENVSVQVTASNQVTNIPSNFGAPQFRLDKPWFYGALPGFAISATPSSSMLVVDPGFNMPGLSITNHDAPNNGLTWYYWCDGLTFHYTTQNPAATVVFTGTIDDQQPGGGVQCTCTGSACSTTATVSAKLVVR
jgi:hypothetical protein